MQRTFHQMYPFSEEQLLKQPALPLAPEVQVGSGATLPSRSQSGAPGWGPREEHHSSCLGEPQLGPNLQQTVP